MKDESELAGFKGREGNMKQRNVKCEITEKEKQQGTFGELMKGTHVWKRSRRRRQSGQMIKRVWIKEFAQCSMMGSKQRMT